MPEDADVSPSSAVVQSEEHLTRCIHGIAPVADHLLRSLRSHPSAQVVASQIACSREPCAPTNVRGSLSAASMIEALTARCSSMKTSGSPFIDANLYL